MKVFIVGGAGAVGSALAACLASQQVVEQVVLQDLNSDAALSHAMDLSQSICLDSRTRVSAGTWEDAAGADVVVIAAGLPAAQATHDACQDITAMKPMIRSIAEGLNQYCPNAAVLSLTNPLDAFNYVLCRSCNLPARQFIGVSINDSLRFRYAIAEYLHLPVTQIDAMVIGEHSPDKLPLFSSVTVQGKKAAFSPAQSENILSTMNSWWGKFLDVSGNRTAAWTTGRSGALTIEYLAGKRTGPICCSSILEEGLSIGYPVYLGPGGVTGIYDLQLTPEEQRSFQAARENAKASISRVRAFMQSH